METIALGLIAVVTLSIAGYAQYRIPFHTRGSWNRILARLLLIVAGIGLGFVSAAIYTTDLGGFQRFLAFLSGFGVVHIPAAVILFIKRQRGVTR